MSGNKTTAKLGVMPVWAKIDAVTALTGVPDNTVRRLYNEGVVRARKTDGAKRNSACVFRLQDVLEWLDEAADEPPKFRLPGDTTAAASRGEVGE